MCFTGKFIQLVCYEVYIHSTESKQGDLLVFRIHKSRHFFIDDKNSIGCPFFIVTLKFLVVVCNNRKFSFVLVPRSRSADLPFAPHQKAEGLKVILQQKKPAFIFVLCFLSLFLCSSLLSMKHTDTLNGIFNQPKLKTKSIERL